MRHWGSEDGNSVYLEQCPACDYLFMYDTVTQKPKEGDDDFIDVDVTATYQGSGYMRPLISLCVHMCPKCGTLIGQI